MNLDQLIRHADPAASVKIPDYDSALARGTAGRMFRLAERARVRRRRLYLIAPAPAAAAVALAIALTATSGTVGPSVSAAASVLDQAAASAARSAPLVLRPGDFLYTRIRSLSDSSYAEDGVHFEATYVYTTQTWQTAGGVGKAVTTDNTKARIIDGTRPAWIKAGRPKLARKGSKYVSRLGPPGAVPPDNLSHLPTDPAALAREIKQRKTGLADLSADVEDPSTPGGTFFVAMLLLTDPSVGGSPALTSALFLVMAAQPGDKVLGRARARDGRRGIAILTPPLGVHGTDVFKVIISPKTGQVLEYDEYTHLGGFDEQWSDFLSTAVVHRIGQLPARDAGPGRH